MKSTLKKKPRAAEEQLEDILLVFKYKISKAQLEAQVMNWFKSFLSWCIDKNPMGTSKELSTRKDKQVEDAVADIFGNPGRTFGASLEEVTGGANLVEGMQTWELADTHKHDVDKMKACCSAEVITFRRTGLCPAPYYFERVAILSRKAKNYAQEVEYCKMYIDLIAEYDLIRAQRGGWDAKTSPTYRGICKRVGKAEVFLAKKKAT